MPLPLTLFPVPGEDGRFPEPPAAPEVLGWLRPGTTVDFDDSASTVYRVVRPGFRGKVTWNRLANPTDGGWEVWLRLRTLTLGGVGFVHELMRDGGLYADLMLDDWVQVVVSETHRERIEPHVVRPEVCRTEWAFYGLLADRIDATLLARPWLLADDYPELNEDADAAEALMRVDREAADREFARLFRVHRGDGAVHLRRGHAYEAVGEWNAAEADYRRAAELLDEPFVIAARMALERLDRGRR